MGKHVKKSDRIAERRKKILEFLAAGEGQAGYGYITKKLNECGYKVGERSVRGDCRHLIEQGLAVKVKKGVAITGEGRNFLKSGDIPEESLKEKYLKQVAILKFLYDSEMRAGTKGLLPGEIARREGMGSEDTVKDILQKMAGEGLVVQEGDRWRLGPDFPRPLPVEGKNARMLYEYLNTVSGLVPLPPDLAMLKSKLAPLLVMPRRDRWREELVKLVERVIVHGRGAGENHDILQVMALVEEAVFSRRVIYAVYRERRIKLCPLGVVYHWEKGQWYVIAQNPAHKTIMAYLLSRFSRVKTGDETFNWPEGFDLKKYLASRWGISSDGETEVAVRFKSTGWHPTALDKLRGDVSRRLICHKHCRLEQQPDGSVILHDKVAGLSEFAAWLRSYGDAAEVLNPDSLRRMMAGTGEKMLKRYGQGGMAGEQ